MQPLSMSASAYKSPVFIGLLGVMSVAVVLLLHHCILVTCCNGGGGGARDRRRRRTNSASAGSGGGGGGNAAAQDDASYSVDLSSSSQVQLVQPARAVVCRYRKEEDWSETTCPVCLADFADGEAVRVLPECMHYFHADCIDTWLRGNTSCPMCRAETTPTPSPASLLHQLSISISLEDVLHRPHLAQPTSLPASRSPGRSDGRRGEGRLQVQGN